MTAATLATLAATTHETTASAAIKRSSVLLLTLLAVSAPAFAAAPSGETSPSSAQNSTTAPRSIQPLPARLLAELNATPQRGTGAAPADGDILGEINSRFRSDSRLDSADIKVESRDGSITLSGHVRNDETRQAAEEIVRQVEGVTRVDNRITSPSFPAPPPESSEKLKERGSAAMEKTEQVASDSWITTKIRSALLADSQTRSRNIGVKTVNGVVTLTGRVADQAELARSIQIVKDIKGVKDVDITGLKVDNRE